jgi:hypothetical protein
MQDIKEEGVKLWIPLKREAVYPSTWSIQSSHSSFSASSFSSPLSQQTDLDIGDSLLLMSFRRERAKDEKEEEKAEMAKMIEEDEKDAKEEAELFAALVSRSKKEAKKRVELGKGAPRRRSVF